MKRLLQYSLIVRITLLLLSDTKASSGLENKSRTTEITSPEPAQSDHLNSQDHQDVQIRLQRRRHSSWTSHSPKGKGSIPSAITSPAPIPAADSIAASPGSSSSVPSLMQMQSISRLKSNRETSPVEEVTESDKSEFSDRRTFRFKIPRPSAEFGAKPDIREGSVTQIPGVTGHDQRSLDFIAHQICHLLTTS